MKKIQFLSVILPLCCCLFSCDSSSKKPTKKTSTDYGSQYIPPTPPPPPPKPYVLTEKDIRFTEEIFNVEDNRHRIHYKKLDELLKDSVDINLVYKQRYIRETLSSHLPIFQDFADKYDTTYVKGNALTVAANAYEWHTSDSKRLIRYLLENGANPNTEYSSIAIIVSYISEHLQYHGYSLSQIKWIVRLFKKYAYDMNRLDLSLSHGNWSAFKYLKKEGANKYFNMTYLIDSEIKNFHRHRKELADVELDFKGISYHDFPFERDAKNLRYFLELGLPPHSIKIDYYDRCNPDNHACVSVLKAFKKKEEATRVKQEQEALQSSKIVEEKK